MRTPDKGETWGIMGGTFDPVHLGHTALALNIKRELELDGIMLIPSFYHPFKNDIENAAYNQRIDMLALAVDNKPDFFISEIEKEENLSGYTVDTVKAVIAKYPDTFFMFIIGADNIKGIEKWQSPDEIFANIEVVAGSRPGDNHLNETAEFKNKIKCLKTEELDISSTQIRELFKKNESEETLLKLIDKRVYNYIKENNLYQ